MANQHTPTTYKAPKVKNWPILILGIFGILILIILVSYFIVDKGAFTKDIFGDDGSFDGASLVEYNQYDPSGDTGQIYANPVSGIISSQVTNQTSTNSNNQTANNQTNTTTNQGSGSGGSGFFAIDTRNEQRCANLSKLTNVWDCAYCKGQFVKQNTSSLQGTCQERNDANNIRFACEGESGLGKECLVGGTTSPIGYQCGTIGGGSAYCCKAGDIWDGNSCSQFCCGDISTLDTQTKCGACNSNGIYWDGNSCVQANCNNLSEVNTPSLCQSCGKDWDWPSQTCGGSQACGDFGTLYKDCSTLEDPVPGFGVCKHRNESTTTFTLVCGVPKPVPEQDVCIEKCQVEPRVPLVGQVYLGESVKSACCPGTELVGDQCRSACTYGVRLSDGCPAEQGSERWPVKTYQASGASGVGVCGTQDCADDVIKASYDIYVTSKGVGYGDLGESANLYYKAVADGVIPDTEEGLGTLLAYQSVGSVGRPADIQAWFTAYYS